MLDKVNLGNCNKQNMAGIIFSSLSRLGNFMVEETDEEVVEFIFSKIRLILYPSFYYL